MSEPDAASGPPGPAPVDLAARVAWLVDRAEISDLLVEFARTLDQREWQEHVALYTADGVFEAGDAFRLVGHAELIRTGSPQALGQYAGTWHLSSNHAIRVEGDTATARSYLLGVHLLGPDPAGHADGGGWYDSRFRRTPDGWRFTHVRITEIWRAGEPLPHMAGPPGRPAHP